MIQNKARTIPGVWLDLSLRAQGLIVVMIPLSALIFSFVTWLVVDRQRQNSNFWVRHTQEVRAEIAETLTGMLNAETGVRGYLLTEDSAYLEPYHAAEQALPRAMAHLFDLVQDNGQQTARLHRLQEVAGQKITIMRELMEAEGSVAPDKTQLARGKALMDTLRDQLSVMDRAEERLLGERSARLEQFQRWAGFAEFGSVAMGLLGGLVAIQLFSKGIVRRVQRLEENTGRLAGELPLLPSTAARDEIGTLARGLENASALLTQRRRELREETARFRLFVEGVQDYAIFMLDPTGRVVSWNAGAQRIKGYQAEEIIGEHFSRFYAPEEIKAGKPERELTIAAKEGRYEEEGWRLRKDGSQFWACVSITAVRDEAGELCGFAKVTRDSTARKVADESLHAAKEEAERANRAKSEFLSRTSHELRTPLNAILGFGQLLELEALEPRQAEAVEHILKAGRHLLGLVNEVLDIASIEAGRLSLSPEPVSAQKLLRNVLELVRPLAERGHIRLEDNFSESAEQHVLADQQRLQQVLLNLLSNAIKYNRCGGTVTVSCTESDADGQLTIKVSDTGDGIAPADLGRLFTPFERLGAERTTVEGTGLGLALAKRLVELMDGKIGTESELGQGSTFWLELPLVEGPMEHHDRNGAAAHAPQMCALEKECTVLYVEDNLSNLALIEHLFENRPEIRLLSAMQGSIGLDLALEHQPDMILLDLHLPDLCGDQVLARLRSDPRTSAIPVVLISADATTRQIERLLAAGAHRYLTKPLDVRELFRVLDQILESSCRGMSGTDPPWTASFPPQLAGEAAIVCSRRT